VATTATTLGSRAASQTGRRGTACREVRDISINVRRNIDWVDKIPVSKSFYKEFFDGCAAMRIPASVAAFPTRSVATTSNIFSDDPAEVIRGSDDIHM
jgi:hypothetical protein